MQEIGASVITRSILIVDQREAALSEAGDIVIPIQQGLITKDHIHAELGEVISGFRKGRTDESQITVFKSVGNAVQDLAIAHGMMLG
jgi:ornithine cyclodeaminase/alanine dehydrogenase-like protein (mu-crystallin family)